MTFNTLFEHLVDVRKDTSDLGEPQKLRIANYIEDKFYEAWWRADPTFWFEEEVITVASGTASYPRASDFKTDKVNNGGIYPTNTAGAADGRPLKRTRYGSTLLGEYRDGTNIIFTPVHSAAAKYIHRYIPVKEQVTGLNEESILPEDCTELWRNAALVADDVWDEDAMLEPFDDARFKITMDKFIETIPQSIDEGVDTTDSLLSF